ncbi:unnamed protein product, partial [Mesorhabditis belari]|uniref:Uncharacterized protein n=1 Tax=Mesorhabditis belari TaxID=2138241 RepID=A0AAF3ETM3_9BILA
MSGEPQWTFYEDITDTLSRDFLEGEDLQLQVHQAKWNGRLLSFELRNFSKNEVEVEFKKREPTMIYINRRDSENRYSRRVAAGESEPFMFNLDWDLLQETIKDWATQVELFPHVDLHFYWKDAQDETIFMKYRCLRFDLKEWNETRLPTRNSSNRHWIPSFTKQRPLLGGRDLMRPLLCDNDEESNLTERYYTLCSKMSPKKK